MQRRVDLPSPLAATIEITRQSSAGEEKGCAILQVRPKMFYPEMEINFISFSRSRRFGTSVQRQPTTAKRRFPVEYFYRRDVVW